MGFRRTYTIYLAFGPPPKPNAVPWNPTRFAAGNKAARTPASRCRPEANGCVLSRDGDSLSGEPAPRLDNKEAQSSFGPL